MMKTVYMINLVHSQCNEHASIENFCCGSENESYFDHILGLSQLICAGFSFCFSDKYKLFTE